MAQVKISALTAADPLTGIEEAPFVQGGSTKKATTEQIREYVASQPNVFSVTQRIEDAAPALQFSENDTTDQNWEFIGVAGALRLDELNDAFSTTGTHHTFTHGGGTQFGSPTGGDQGAGTVNAEGLYENGTGVAKLSGGADANFTAMPQVGGDPIVESDSNADGEFARWADGTQACRASFVLDNVVNTTNLHGEWTFPSPFVSAPEGVGGIETSRNYTPEGNEMSATKAGTPTATSVNFKHQTVAGASETFGAGDTATFSVFAIGPWK